MIYIGLLIATVVAIAVVAVMAFQVFIHPPADSLRDSWPNRLQQGGSWGKNHLQDVPPEEPPDDA